MCDVRIKLSEHEGVAERKKKESDREIEVEREKQVRLINKCCVKLRYNASHSGYIIQEKREQNSLESHLLFVFHHYLFEPRHYIAAIYAMSDVQFFLYTNKYCGRLINGRLMRRDRQRGEDKKRNDWE